jgi:hypothetical protein
MNQKSIRPGRKARLIVASVLMVVFIGGSLFYVAAQRHSATGAGSQTVSAQLNGQSSLSALPESGAVAAASAAAIQEFYCASDDGRRHYCTADTRGGVRMVRQRSDSACIQGRTWGYDRRGVWVDRGCRADFATSDRYSGRDRDRGRDYGRGGGGRDVQTFYCESGDMKRHWCSEGQNGRVRLVRQRSDAACIQGRTWGQDRGGVWVDRGCRADFEVVRR